MIIQISYTNTGGILITYDPPGQTSLQLCNPPIPLAHPIYRERQTIESVCANRLCIGTAPMAVTGQSENVHVLAGIFSLDNLYLAGKPLLLVKDKLVNFGVTLPYTSRSNACWDIGGNSHLTWLSSDSLYICPNR